MNVDTVRACAPLPVGQGARAGLVSVSTSHTGWQDLNSAGLPTVIWMAENAILIDRQKARVTRLRKAVGVAAKLIHNALPTARKCMVTLTYRGDNRDWSAKHISFYITNVRNWYKRLTGQPLRYVWVGELQGRGVIHYHAVFWTAKGVTMPRADKRGWWPYGMTKTEIARKPIGYLMSYVSKIESKNVQEFPHGARIFGVGGLDKSGADIKRWVLWPSYLQGNVQVGEPYKRSLGGGFTHAETGEHFRSEYAPSGGGFKTFVRVYRHERKIDASGPFSWFESSTVH